MTVMRVRQAMAPARLSAGTSPSSELSPCAKGGMPVEAASPPGSLHVSLPSAVQMHVLPLAPGRHACQPATRQLRRQRHPPQTGRGVCPAGRRGSRGSCEQAGEKTGGHRG